MRAAVLRGHRSAPRLEQWQPPASGPGEALIELRAAPITPLDLLCASGASYFGPPALPYVPGVQGVGLVMKSAQVPAGTMAWFCTTAGMAPGDGSLRECCSVLDGDLVPLSYDVAPELVAALGLSAVAAWMAVTWRGDLHAGEQVIVLGAGGTVGQVAVQVAKLRGARRVIAGCRSAAGAERARRCGADAVVRLDTDNVSELASRFADASDGPSELIIDPLFGVPAAAALRTAGRYGRLVQLGGAAAESAPIDSATLRSRSLCLLGYTNNELSPAQRADALNTVLSLAADGRLSVAYESVSLDSIAQAWSRQARGEASVRIVVTS
jgi:NADPH:quinone reductase-like Zn-dependent oxidoreductase